MDSVKDRDRDKVMFVIGIVPRPWARPQSRSKGLPAAAGFQTSAKRGKDGMRLE